MSSAPHVLPLPAERLLGRDQELAGLEAALLDPDVRLVTLTGPGGVGKSRLALAARRRTAAATATASCTSTWRPSPTRVSCRPSCAAATGGSNAAAQSAAEALRLQLHDKQMLVVLDNCEHLVSVAAVVSDLVAACPVRRHPGHQPAPAQREVGAPLPRCTAGPAGVVHPDRRRGAAVAGGGAVRPTSAAARPDVRPEHREPR
jgi:hypothetical protein